MTNTSSTLIGPGRRLLMVVGALTLAVGLAACSSSSSSSTSTTATTAAGSGTTTAPTGGTSITISSFKFSPASLTVKPGAKVTVDNKDPAPHTVTSSSGGFDTGQISGGSSGSFTAPTTPGTYSYICSNHTFMSGTLVVSSS